MRKWLISPRGRLDRVKWEDFFEQVAFEPKLNVKWV